MQNDQMEQRFHTAAVRRACRDRPPRGLTGDDASWIDADDLG